MAKRRTRIPLNVFINARLLGQLNRETSGAIDFRYDPSWLDWEHALPVSLSLPLREDRYIGDPVIAVFDNLLPDSDDIRKNLAERVKANGYDAYSLLTAIGRDCVGALQFLPEGDDPGPAGTISGRPADDAEIGRLISNLSNAPLGVDEDTEFRISLAGAQEKTALLYWKNKWHIPTRTTATTHILKPQIGMLANGIDMTKSVENEHFCMRLMAELGLPTAKTEIQDFDGTRVLVVERFDRIWTRDKRLIRRPQEDLCQALSIPPTRKYQADGGPGMSQVLDLLKGSDDPDTDQKLFIKAQIIFWLIGATDGHAKNFSLFLTPGGQFSMTPIYDVLSAQPNMDAGQIRHNQMKLALSIGDKRHYVIEEIVPRHFYQTAKRCGIAESMITDILTELLEAIPEALNKTIAAMPTNFPTRMATSIKTAALSRLKSVGHAVNLET
jgi:serine/threonine-protein kinase HipA